MLDVGTAVSSDTEGTDRIIAAIGNNIEFPGYERHVVAVKFKDGGFGIVVLHASGRMYEWEADRKDALDAVRGLREMPHIEHGVRPDVLYVWGKDSKGAFLAKLFLGDGAKNVERRPDELYRGLFHVFKETAIAS